MRSVIIVQPDFERIWPLAADHFAALWRAEGDLEFQRLAPDDRRPVSAIIALPETVTRLAALSVPLTASCAARLTGLRELASVGGPYTTAAHGEDVPGPVAAILDAARVRRYRQPSEGFWGQSVAEFALALTLCGLRRIPQLHLAMQTDPTVWDYEPPGGVGQPGSRGHQYCDDPRFTGGTVVGKRVRIVGAGNIASRYAAFVHALGADVAAYDPYAPEPGFHRAGSRREYHLDRLVQDAEIFAPLVPLTPGTRGLVTAAQIAALPRGCLVVLATRAGVVDTDALRARVLADELALAADVFDTEPLPLDDPLMGRHNVVHTPHIAGRTRDANERWAEALATQFLPVVR